MKRHLIFILICMLFAVLTLTLPYVQELTNGEVTNLIDGYHINLAWYQFLIYLVIILISGIKQTIVTALVGLVFCSSFFLFFILLSTDIMLVQLLERNFGSGYFYAIMIAVIFWLLHVLNLIFLIRNTKSKMNTKIDLLGTN